MDNNNPDRLERISFAFFLKILFQLIESDRLVCDQAKLLVSACLRQHRHGNSKHKNIIDVIELTLRGLVQRNIWRSARRYAKAYERKYEHRMQLAADNNCDDQDLLEIELLQPFLTSGSTDFDDYDSNNFEICKPLEPAKILSSQFIPDQPNSSIECIQYRSRIESTRKNI
ncbi:MAG: hypothetical protein SGBAC_005689 [Bacillariaceae sp.]